MNAFTFSRPDTPSGVYHLLFNGRVVYVGASANVLGRVNSWVKRGAMLFDQIRVFPTPVNCLAEVEQKHIERYQPEHNTAGISSPYSGHRKWNTFHIKDGSEYYMSEVEFLETQSEFIGTGILKTAHIAQNMEDALVLVNLLGFPAPVFIKFNRWPRWRRDEVLSWLQGAYQESAA